jgi:hypothetical protein
MRFDTLPLLSLKTDDLTKRTAKTDLFVPTAPGPNAKYQEFDTLRSMNGWEQRFVTPPGVVEEVHGASGGGQIRLSMIQGTAEQDYIRGWMNARPETIGMSYNDVRFGNHTMFEPLVSYQIEHSTNHPLLMAYNARRDAMGVSVCDAQTTQLLGQFNGVFTYSTDWLQHVPAFMAGTDIEYFKLPNVNEQIVCHGTSVRYAESIMNKGFKATFEMSQNPESAETATHNEFTVGNYFADVASLADLYAKPFAGPPGAGNISCMVICRALLGCPVITTPTQIRVNNNFWGQNAYQRFSAQVGPDYYEDYTRVRPEIAANHPSSIIMGTEGTRSEFVTYGTDLALPVGLVFYQRGNDR